MGEVAVGGDDHDEQGKHGQQVDLPGIMDIIPVSRLDEVVAKALVRVPAPIVWEEETSKVDVKPDASDEASGGLTAH